MPVFRVHDRTPSQGDNARDQGGNLADDLFFLLTKGCPSFCLHPLFDRLAYPVYDQLIGVIKRELKFFSQFPAYGSFPRAPIAYQDYMHCFYFENRNQESRIQESEFRRKTPDFLILSFISILHSARTRPATRVNRVFSIPSRTLERIFGHNPGL